MYLIISFEYADKNQEFHINPICNIGDLGYKYHIIEHISQ